MAGYPADFACKKNKYVEEWNGLREITEKTFQFNFQDLPTFVACLVLVPLGLYYGTRQEFLDRDDRRYKDIF